MKVLIGCEESQRITLAYRSRGIKAVSCDILPTRGNPDWHIQGDIMSVIETDYWDLVILHPDCTAMAVSGNRWYGEGMPKNSVRHSQIRWTLNLFEKAKRFSKRVALENPVSVIFKYFDNVQYIHPWQFGHGETKKTGFALHELPKLIPTKIVEGRENRIHRMPPSATRKRDRSVTYKGIADAISEQWVFD